MRPPVRRSSAKPVKAPDQLKALRQKVALLKERLEEAEETITAVRSGSVDAFVIQDHGKARVFTLEGADRPYRLFVEQMQQGAATLHADGTIAYCNRRLAELLQIPHEKLIGARLHEFVPGADRPQFESLLRAATRDPVQGETHFRKADASLVPAHLTIHCPGDATRCLLLTDLTATRLEEQRRHAEERLRESEENFRALAENIPQLSWITDEHGTRIWFNRRWYEYTGTTLEEVRGWGWQQLHHPDHRERVMSGWKAALQSGQLWEDTFPLRGRDGQFRWFLSRAFPIRDSSSRITRWFGTNTDVTELLQTQEALKKAQDELHHVNLALEDRVTERTAQLRESVNELQHVSYAITHDMRAPLRAMGAFAQMLLDESSGGRSEAQDYCRRIVAGANRLDKLIHDALGYTRSVLTACPLEVVNLSKLLLDLIEAYPNLLLEKANIHIEGTLPSVLGNESLLTQCFSNLLGNAVKFVPEGATPRVRVWSETNGGVARVFIQDNGIGIPQQAQSRLFGMFQKLDNEYEGTGIGLAIVRKVAERMGGKVGVVSEPGKGSCFSVELPLPGSATPA